MAHSTASRPRHQLTAEDRRKGGIITATRRRLKRENPSIEETDHPIYRDGIITADSLHDLAKAGYDFSLDALINNSTN